MDKKKICLSVIILIIISLFIISLILIFNNEYKNTGIIGICISIIGSSILYYFKENIKEIFGSSEPYSLPDNYPGLFYLSTILYSNNEYTKDELTYKEAKHDLMKTKSFPVITKFKQLLLSNTPMKEIFTKIRDLQKLTLQNCKDKNILPDQCKNEHVIPIAFRLLDKIKRNKIFDPQNRPEFVSKVNSVNNLIDKRNTIIGDLYISHRSKYGSNTELMVDLLKEKNKLVSRMIQLNNLHKAEAIRDYRGRRTKDMAEVYRMHSRQPCKDVKRLNDINKYLDECWEENKKIEDEFNTLNNEINKQIKEYGFKNIIVTK